VTEKKQDKMTLAKRAGRHADIVEAWLRGLGPTQIAATFSLSQRQVYRVIAEYKESQPVLTDQDPIAILEERLMKLEAAAQEYALIAQTTKSEQIRVAAISKRLDAYQQATELMQKTGILPNNLGTLGVTLDVKQLAKRVVDTVEELGLSAEQAQSVLEAITGEVFVIESEAVEE